MSKNPNQSTDNNISFNNVSGSAIAFGVGQATVNNHSTTEAFDLLRESVNGLPEGQQKEKAQNAVKNLEAEAKKAEPDSNQAREWLEFLLGTLGDAGEVALNTFINPALGFSTAFRKIAERAKEERTAKSKS